MGAYNDAVSVARQAGQQPPGDYPIHIIVKGRRVTFYGIVNSEADKTMVNVRAREVGGVFGVDNQLMVKK
jgi:osmotically-inducible protein OsmY